MQWLGPELVAKCEGARSPVLLSICPDIDRMQSREHALHGAGYVVASATTLFAAQEMSHLCSFDIVLLDHECAREDGAIDLKERFISLLLEPGTSDSKLLAKLSEMLRMERSSASVH